MHNPHISSEFHGISPSTAKKRFPYTNLILLVLTAVTVTFAGLLNSYEYTIVKDFGIDAGASDIPSLQSFLSNPGSYRLAFAYAFSLLGILGAHELGHYLACRKYNVNASFPFFLPGIPPIGTFGAFIKIRNLFPSRKITFDVGAAGPIAGFLVALPVTVFGLINSIPLKTAGSDVIEYGEPLLMIILNGIIFSDIPADYGLYLHPVAFAGWIGLFATGLNLIPIGQMDGGHISYALFGKKSAFIGKTAFLLLLPFLYFSPSVLIWGFFFLIMKFRHPESYICDRLDKKRKALAGLSLVIFILCFVPVPVYIPEWSKWVRETLRIFTGVLPG